MYDSDDDGDAPADFDNDDDMPELDLDALEEKIKIQAKTGEPEAKPRKRRGPPPPPHHISAAPVVKAEPMEDVIEMSALPHTTTTVTVKVEPVTMKADMSSTPAKPEPSDDVPQWTSALQLRTFWDNAKTIADAYVKEKGLKLRSRAGRDLKYNWAAFDKGWEDGKKVDLKRRKIEDK
ncbi:hypothetical protein DXG03_004228 [Asterophora parasitica]|uniref:Uncharacterized protein n=1 Tax=Asterophora parasitica TaxID=117018 RepID=A0A9P7GBA2_9AGAR|nr:hypothetical protein DXG03_004228 [Asterophora parasitica]